ncbi:MAG: TetR/AcrR family transcriptional regulator [Synergistaceae bacterium]|nr:TetR/AcrR family transcriptional regulator [Synergistaceae bacterium]
MKQNRRQIQKEATRKKIVETAVKVYSRDGFSAPSNVVAIEAGVAHGTVFVHFPTTGDLLMAVLQRFFIQMLGKLHDLSESSGIDDFLRGHIEILQSCEDFYKRLLTEARLLPEEARGTLESIRSVALQHFTSAAEYETRRGAVKDVPIDVMFNAWLGLVHYYMQNMGGPGPGESVLGRYKGELVSNFSALIKK